MTNTVIKILLRIPNTCNSPLTSTVTFLLLYPKFLRKDMHVGLHTAVLTEYEVTSLLHVSGSLSLLAQYNNMHHFPVVCSNLLKFYEFLYNKTNYMHQLHKFILAWNSTCFGQFLCPSSGVYSLYTQQWYMSYRFVHSFRAGPGSWSCSKAVYKPVWHIPLLSVQWMISWWWTDELSKTCGVSCQNNICEISESTWFYHKEMLRCTITWT